MDLKIFFVSYKNCLQSKVSLLYFYPSSFQELLLAFLQERNLTSILSLYSQVKT
nr:MAG TPA: hypothetical protein [Caudoviricetes sp.]